ncbi:MULTISPECIES: DeoR/GlpR family DNA-binding transcription regulator [unclassified Streptomyces]|uniref:DeoR/GlpR family DNA-binding transcription regulator n=1 Tax=unclassified Streptomyces TaxID=2593676 RepID=UPI00168B45BA|nr:MULTISPECIES: DeoR/GlpR family DNA-binding transcription regulator [unclassified Streptomyces]MBD3003183.1 DeoR/GlpR transcriptional regulator [Streptomyces sp. 5-10]
MTSRKRHAKIVESLRSTGVASVRELAENLQVSESTIRRDLTLLDRNGELLRTYGGAALTPHGVAEAAGAEVDETPFDLVISRDEALKEAIAEEAVKLVEDDSVIVLDIGTTPLAIARRLRGRPVTVITSSLPVLDVLRDDDAVRLVMLGGVLRRNYQSLVGSLTEQALRQVSADLLFLSCTGVRPNGHVVDNMAVEAPLKQAMIETAGKVVLVAVETKFPGTGSLRVCSLSDVDVLITTSGADPNTLQLCREADGKVILA